MVQEEKDIKNIEDLYDNRYPRDEEEEGSEESKDEDKLIEMLGKFS